MRLASLLTGALLGAAALPAVLPNPAVAQVTSWAGRGSAIAERDRAWIGISFDVQEDRSGRTRAVIVTDVRPGSPAAEAGVRRGDRILSVNELRGVRELAQLNDRLKLRVGDDVRMQVLRDGRRRELLLEAAPRPDDFQPSSTVRFSLEADSMVETWVRAMDSLTVALTSARDGTLRIAQTVRAGDGPGRITVVSGDGEEFVVRPEAAVKAPFEFFVFRGEAHDSLSREMAEVNRVARELEERLAQRERQIRRRTRDARRVELERDYQFRRLNEALQQVEARSAELEMAMAEAARKSAGVEYARENYFSPRERVERVREANEVHETPEFRPLTPYLLGRNRVAGAEVIDLRAELARYFDVGSGVLVVDVAPGTPASLAGIEPGDVITRIDQVGVRSVEDLRFGVSMAGDTLPVTLIRQGSSVQVLLRR